MYRVSQDTSHAAMRTYAWIIIIAAASVALSRSFACVMPFAAIAAIAGSQLERREAICAVLLAWLGNQAVGFLLLGYPHTASTLAWGVAIGLAALSAAGLAAAAASVSARPFVRGLVALVAAFAAYEGVLLAATLILPSSTSAFAPAVVARIFAINAIAFAALFILHRAAVGGGLLPRTGGPQAATA